MDKKFRFVKEFQLEEAFKYFMKDIYFTIKA